MAPTRWRQRCSRGRRRPRREQPGRCSRRTHRKAPSGSFPGHDPREHPRIDALGVTSRVEFAQLSPAASEGRRTMHAPTAETMACTACGAGIPPTGCRRRCDADAVTPATCRSCLVGGAPSSLPGSREGAPSCGPRSTSGLAVERDVERRVVARVDGPFARPRRCCSLGHCLRRRCSWRSRRGSARLHAHRGADRRVRDHRRDDRAGRGIDHRRSTRMLGSVLRRPDPAQASRPTELACPSRNALCAQPPPGRAEQGLGY